MDIEKLVKQMLDGTTAVKDRVEEMDTATKQQFEENGSRVEALELNVGQLSKDLVSGMSALRSAQLAQGQAPKVSQGRFAGMSEDELEVLSVMLQSPEANKKLGETGRAAFSDEVSQAFKGLTGVDLVNQTATTTNNSDIILPGMSRNIWGDFPQITGVANRIQIIPGVTDGQKIPVERDVVPFYKIDEEASAEEVNSTGRNVKAHVVKVGAKFSYSTELVEDQYLSIAQLLARQIRKSIIANTEESVILADTTTGNANLNNVGGAIAGTNRRFTIGYNGLMARMFGTTGQSDVAAARDVSITLLKKMINKIQGGVVNRNAFLACDPMTYFSLITMDDVIDSAKFGASGPLQRGVLAQLFGKDIVVSEYIPLTAATGKVSSTAANNTLGTILYIDPTRYSIPVTRNVTIQQEFNMDKDVNWLYVRFRRGFQGVNDADNGWASNQTNADDGVAGLSSLNV